MVTINNLLRNLRNKILRTYAQIVINNKPPFIVFDAKGMKFFVKRKDALDQLLLSDNGFDNGLPYALNALQDAQVGCAVDVGANAGYYTIPFSQTFEHVYAFEPNANIREKLQKNISLNSIANISTYPFAVGAHNKKSKFFLQESFDGDYNLNFGLSSLAKRNQYTTSSIVVDVITLDQFLPDKRIKLIKIDCEGAEYDVLKGSIKLLTSQKPIVCWEASALINVNNLKKSFNLFFRLGYSHFKFTEDKKFIKLTNLENNLLSLNLNIISIFEGVEK